MPTIFSKEVLGNDRIVGFYDTPIKTVAYLCEPILKSYKKGQTICDPTVGDGVFLRYLVSKGIEKSCLFGFDIEQKKVRSLSTEFKNVSVFDATNPFKQKFDYVVGNPPYNGDDSHWVRENRDRLFINSSEIGGPKNTYTIISYNAIEALNDNGIFSMILSDSFLTNIYYKEFRIYLLKQLDISELLLAPRRLFFQKSADVRTCIIVGTRIKPQFSLNDKHFSHNGTVKLVDRVNDEDEYKNPKRVELVKQTDFLKYPNNTFLIGVPVRFRDLYLNAQCRLGDLVEGGTGISTGNDKRFLKPRDEVHGDKDWVPYYKNGARNSYFYKPAFFIHKDYKRSQSLSKTYMIRNERFFFKSGITCSSVGVRFSASFMPEGGLFGVNANFFSKDPSNVFFLLGLLNSKVAWYFCRRILIRTNNISANYLRLLPVIIPSNTLFKEISTISLGIVNSLIENIDHDFGDAQAKIDSVVFDIYKCDKRLINHVNDFCNNFYDMM